MADVTTISGVISIVYLVGFWMGTWAEARRWRSKGDHEYLNRMESAGRLYEVKRES